MIDSDVFFRNMKFDYNTFVTNVFLVSHTLFCLVRQHSRNTFPLQFILSVLFAQYLFGILQIDDYQ